MSQTFEQLARYLLDQQEAIVDRWRQACQQDDELGIVTKLTHDQFRNNIPAAIEGLCRVLRLGPDAASAEGVRKEIAKHGHHRWKQGFRLEELIRDWGNLNRVLVATIHDFFTDQASHATNDRAAVLDRLAQFISESTSSSVWRFDDLRRAEAAALAKELQTTKDEFEAVTEARGNMLREAAHDIRGNLAAVAMASRVLKDFPQDEDSFTQMLDVLDRSVESVKQMLDSLLDLARLESGAESLDLLSVDIAEVLEQLSAEYTTTAEENGLALKTAGPDEMVVRTDPEKVRRIAQNLVVNALQHTTAGEVQISWGLGQRCWKLEVRDTGPGIQNVLGSTIARELDNPDRGQPTQEMKQSLAYTGEGIGLTIVKRLCTMLDAGITLESELGRGTTFTIEFPMDYDDD